MITIQPVVDSIKKELGSVFSTEAHKDSDIYRYMNSAAQYIRNYRDFAFLKKVFAFVYTSANTEAIIPYNVKTYKVKMGDEFYHILSNEEWIMTEDHTLCVGIAGDRFVAPVTGTFQILYSGVFDPIDANTTEIDLPPNFDYIFRQLAISFGYKDRQQYDKSQALIGEANAFLNSITDRNADPTPSQPVRIGSKHYF